MLTRFGFAHGWRMAEAMQAQFKWDSDDDWRRAGARIHALEGLYPPRARRRGPLSREGATSLASYEAEQHILHFGRSDAPVCWTICGLTSGYLSRATARRSTCSKIAAWARATPPATSSGGRARSGATSAPMSCASSSPKRLKECLDVSLQRVTETLKETERKLRERRAR